MSAFQAESALEGILLHTRQHYDKAALISKSVHRRGSAVLGAIGTESQRGRRAHGGKPLVEVKIEADKALKAQFS
jgi:hypothetical protein